MLHYIPIQVSDELNLMKDVGAVRQMAMESSTRQDFPIIQPLSRLGYFIPHEIKNGVSYNSVGQGLEYIYKN